MEMERNTQSHALMVPFTAQGHATPMLQLAQLLVQHGVLVTFHLSDTTSGMLGNPQSTPHIRFVTFPDPEPMSIEEKIAILNPLAVARTEKLIKEQTTLPHFSAVISDSFYTDVRHTARKHGLAAIEFNAVSASAVSLMFHCPLLFQLHLFPTPRDPEARKEFMEKQLKVIPGMEWLRGKDLISIQHDFDAPVDIAQPDGLDAMLVNSCEEIEGQVIHYLNAGDKFDGKLMGIGPLVGWADTMPVQTGMMRGDRECLRWLDKQEDKSVVYASFGSTGMMSATELAELARGLLASGHPFLWAMRADMLDAAGDLMEVIGNEDRVCVVEWAPQREVLEHRAVGASLTHGGWNSVVEAVIAGVPMLCFPTFIGDQAHNRRLLTRVYRVAVELLPCFTKDDVSASVKALMDPDGVARINICGLRQKALDAVSKDGSSQVSFRRLLDIIKTSSNPAFNSDCFNVAQCPSIFIAT